MPPRMCVVSRCSLLHLLLLTILNIYTGSDAPGQPRRGYPSHGRFRAAQRLGDRLDVPT